MRHGNALGRTAGIPRFRPLKSRISLLNGRWHSFSRARGVGHCPACERGILADDEAVEVLHRLYHAGCAP